LARKQAGPLWEKNRRERGRWAGEERNREGSRLEPRGKKKRRRRRKVGGTRWQRRKRKEKKGCWAAVGIKEKRREREIGRGSLRMVLGLGLLFF
jgi:hypothetical protein